MAEETRPVPSWLAPSLFVFALVWIHGALIGLTDDEAYYWALARSPAWGFAFHPPGVAWSIGVFQWIADLFGAGAHPAWVRLPAAFFSAGIVALGLRWISLLNGEGSRVAKSAGVLLSFAGVFGASWMMVPDLPLLFGWMLAFVHVWVICFGEARRSDFVILGLGIAVAVLSKYSGVLVALSAAVAVGLWAPASRKWKAWASIGIGLTIAAVPILIWNASHEWASLLYQLRERHESEGLSWNRYFRFWGIQLLIAGPALVAYALLNPMRALRSPRSKVARYVSVWALPAALVYFIQPAFADFKPHWAFVAWLPFFLEMAWAYSRGMDLKWCRAQMIYGLSLVSLAILHCHVPIVGWVNERLVGEDRADPRWDVSNDLYGWKELPRYLDGLGGAELRALPVVGSRYQTAAQAAFALGDTPRTRVSMIPRDLKQRDEWPELEAFDGQGPQWPKLRSPVLFVADNRYSAGPAFEGASCVKLGRLEHRRSGLLAKWIDVWRCDP